MHVNVNMENLFLVTMIIILTIKYTLLHDTISCNVCVQLCTTCVCLPG